LSLRCNQRFQLLHLRIAAVVAGCGAKLLGLGEALPRRGLVAAGQVQARVLQVTIGQRVASVLL
jgi:hypothetical protein